MKPLCVPIALLLIVLPGCSLFQDDTREVLMPVTAIEAPASVAAGSTFTVQATGALTNGCQSFERIVTDRTGDRVHLRMVATERLGHACTDDVRYVSAEVTVSAGATGPVVVTGEAWGETIERVVEVE